MKKLKNFWAVLLFVLAFLVVFIAQFPAWLAVSALPKARFELVLTEGTLWKGKAQIAWKQVDGSLLVLPGEFVWNIGSFNVLNRTFDISISHQMLIKPITIEVAASFSGQVDLKIDEGQAMLPAYWLTFVGAPFNTLQPDGNLQLIWQKILIDNSLKGNVSLLWNDASASFSPIRPLGNYKLDVDLLTRDWRLMTTKGVLKLEGSGKIGKASIVKATPDADVFQQLRNMMNLLGPRRGNYYEIKAG